ncbi:unnamed protein product [Caenorhabditis brenneri]
MVESSTKRVITKEEVAIEFLDHFMASLDSTKRSSNIDKLYKVEKALKAMCDGASLSDWWGRTISFVWTADCENYVEKTKKSCMVNFEGGICEWLTRHYAEKYCLEPNTPYVCKFEPPQIPGIPRPSPPITTTTTSTTTTTMKPTTENQLISNMIMFVTIGGAVSILLCCAVMYILHQRREARRRRAEREAAMFGMNNWVEGLEAGITDGTKGLGTGWTTTTKSTTSGGTKTKKDKKKKGKKGSITTSTKTDTTGTWL